MRYGIHTESSERPPGDYLTVWSGAFMSDFEGQGIAHLGEHSILIHLEYRGHVLVTLPEGVTFPRTNENYSEIDDAINDAINEHLRVTSSIPDLPPGDDGKLTEHPDPAAPGADDI
ncbi:hypothetical protein SEA_STRAWBERRYJAMM_93 [Microbacterium phage StrawberryJamm]|nr:hypothetical protein SEA_STRAWBERRYJAMM_93 [Microbacterium phage StrawberryJamm]